MNEELFLSHSQIVFKRKYQISAGDDHKPVTALATDLYKFHRLDDGVMNKKKREQKKAKDQKQNTFQSGVGSGFTSTQGRPSRAERFFSRRFVLIFLALMWSLITGFPQSWKVREKFVVIESLGKSKKYRSLGKVKMLP